MLNFEIDSIQCGNKVLLTGFICSPSQDESKEKISFMVKFIQFIDQDLHGLNKPTLTAKQQIFSLNDESISCLIENVIDSICLITNGLIEIHSIL